MARSCLVAQRRARVLQVRSSMLCEIACEGKPYSDSSSRTHAQKSPHSVCIAASAATRRGLGAQHARPEPHRDEARARARLSCSRGESPPSGPASRIDGAARPRQLAQAARPPRASSVQPQRAAAGSGAEPVVERARPAAPAARGCARTARTRATATACQWRALLPGARGVEAHDAALGRQRLDRARRRARPLSAPCSPCARRSRCPARA